jgi:hypothetical protein
MLKVIKNGILNCPELDLIFSKERCELNFNAYNVAKEKECRFLFK